MTEWNESLESGVSRKRTRSVRRGLTEKYPPGQLAGSPPYPYIMDWFSRYVLVWQLSNTLDGRFCLEALQQALRLGRPDIFNSDQGVQFTALEFTGCLEAAGVRISMDGRGRVFDNIFIERLWRSVKYEDIYVKDYRHHRRDRRPRTLRLRPGQDSQVCRLQVTPTPIGRFPGRGDPPDPHR